MIGADSFVQALNHGQYADGANEGGLSPVMETLIGLFALTSIVFTSFIVRKLSRDTSFSLFVFMLAGLALLYLTRVMFIIYEFGSLGIEDETFDLWWHLIFYMGMTCFLIVLYKLTNRSKSNVRETKGMLSKKELLFLVAIGVFPALLFISADFLDMWTLFWFQDSVINEIGLQHFIAFVFAGFIALRLILLRFGHSHNKKSILQPFLIPLSTFFVFISLLSLNHLWELLTESWGVMRLTGYVIETTEQFFWLVAFAFIAYGSLKGYSKIIKESKNKI